MNGEPREQKQQSRYEYGSRSRRAGRKQRLVLSVRGDVTVLEMPEIEIWDGADLALQRETLVHLRDVAGCRVVGIDMRYVKHVPSGFFGMLYDWREAGQDCSVRVYSPQPHVRRMVWFREFFDPVGDDVYILLREPKQYLLRGETRQEIPRPRTRRPSIVARNRQAIFQ